MNKTFHPKPINLIAFIFSITLGLLIVLSINYSANALSGPGYFTGLNSCTTNPSFTACIAGVDPNTNDVIFGSQDSPSRDAIPASVVDKTSFYNWISQPLERYPVGHPSAGQEIVQDRVGRAFIINSMIQAGTGGSSLPKSTDPNDATRLAELQQRLQNPNVTATRVWGDPNDSAYGNGRISFSGLIFPASGPWRDPFYADFNGSPRELIVFRDGANIVYVLEVPCANPVGELGGLDPYNQTPKDLSYSTNTTVGDFYEKGGSAVTFVHTITVIQYPCDPLQPSGSYVMPQVWNTSSTGPNTIGPLNSGNIEFTNCLDANNRIRINGVEQAIGTTYTIDQYSTNPDLTMLNGAITGTKYSRQLTVGSLAPALATFTVTEAPYAQFKGNDVRVCGDGANNRFVWDNRPPSGNDAHGSYGEYATIFSANNSPNSPLTGYQGLNSYKSPPGPGTGTRNDLETLWTTSLCPTFSYAGLSVDSSENFKEEGSWYIDNDVLPPNTDTATPANLYTVKIFYAKKDSDGKGGNIYIAKNVTKINAILIAEGNIYTCAEPNPAKPGEYKTVDQVDLDGECNQPLVINGAIMADQVHLMRASGTRFLDNGAAEVINYPWQLHHATSPLKTTDINDIDAIIDLPPRL